MTLAHFLIATKTGLWAISPALGITFHMEAALTAIGAFAFSIVVSYTPIGKHIDRLAEGFLHPHGEAIDTFVTR